MLISAETSDPYATICIVVGAKWRMQHAAEHVTLGHVRNDCGSTCTEYRTKIQCVTFVA